MYHFGNTVTCDMADGEIVACSVLDIRDWTQIQPRKYSNNSHRTFELKVVSDFSLTQDKYFCIYKKARQHFFRNDAGSVSSVSAEWTLYTRAVNEPLRSFGDSFPQWIFADKHPNFSLFSNTSLP